MLVAYIHRTPRTDKKMLRNMMVLLTAVALCVLLCREMYASNDVMLSFVVAMNNSII